MKKLINLITVLLSLSIMAAGCDDNEKQNKTLDIVKSDTEYSAKGGTGTIETSGVSIAKVESSKDWCIATAQNGNVNIEVKPNGDISERTARIAITPADGAKPVNVYILQEGSRFIIDPDGKSDLVYENGTYSGFFSLSGGNIELEYYSDMPFDVNIETPGLEWNEDNGKLLFNVTPATKPRNLKATISVTFDNGTVSTTTVEIRQSTSYEDLLGDWKMDYRSNSNNGSPTYGSRTVTLTAKEPGVSYTVSNLPVWTSQNIYADFTAYYNSADGTLYIPNRQYLTEFVDSQSRQTYVYLCAIHVTNNNGGWSYHIGTTLRFDFQYDMTADGLKLLYKESVGWASSFGPDGFVAQAFGDNPPINYNNVHFWWTMFLNPSFTKLP